MFRLGGEMSGQDLWMQSFPIPSLSRMMVFADGENMVMRFQNMVEEGRKPRDDISYERDVYVWSPQAVRPDLHHVLRATYYTYVVGTPERVDAMSDTIKSLKFQQYFRPMSDIAEKLGNKLSSCVFKKDKQNRSAKGVDIKMTVDVLVNAYQNNLDTVYLISGDGDYVPVLEEARRLGKRIYVAAFSSGLNSRLKNAADEFLNIDPFFFQPI
jgi:uncharacterized LabA/DUF88 family protein